MVHVPAPGPGHIGLSIFNEEKLWINWLDIDGKKVPVPEVGGSYFRRNELPPRREGTRGGVGLVLEGMSDGRSIGGIDLDGCLVDGALLPWAKEIVEEIGSYCEVSPSGTGVKIFFIVEERARSAVKLFRKQVQWPKHGSAKAWGIECYLSGGRFFTVTDRVFQSWRTVSVVNVKKLRWVNRRMIAFDEASKGQKHVLKAISFMKNDELPWEEWNTRGMGIYNATWGSLAGRDAWITYSKLSGKYEEKETLARWEHWRSSPGDYVHWKQVKAWGQEGGYEPEDDRADELGCRKQVEDLNERWATVVLGKDFYILDTRPRADRLYSLVKKDAWRQSQAGFHPKFGKDNVPLYEIWLESRYRRHYADGVVLAPQGAPPSAFNLWRGWAVEPKQGSWKLFREHLFNVVCDRDLVAWHYLRRWMAWKFQHPEKKIGVAVVLKGDKGTGKTIVADYLMRVFGVHAVRVAQEKHFLGNFNAHLERALFVNGEESFWAGSKKQEGVLKDMVTGGSMVIEPKGVDSYTAPNLLDVLITSNADWVVPSSHDERRYFVVEVSSEKARDFEYFRALAAEMEGAGPSALLFDLMSEDLSSFEPRDVPSTGALFDQKEVSMESHVRFFYEMARTGRVSGLSSDLIVSRAQLYASYCRVVKESGVGRPVSDGVFGKLAVKLVEGRGKVGSRGRQVGVYFLTGLDAFRERFASFMESAGAISWDDEGAEDWLTTGRTFADMEETRGRGNLDFDP